MINKITLFFTDDEIVELAKHYDEAASGKLNNSFAHYLKTEIYVRLYQHWEHFENDEDDTNPFVFTHNTDELV